MLAMPEPQYGTLADTSTIWTNPDLPELSNVPEISASPVNRLVFGIRTFFFWLVLFLDLEQFWRHEGCQVLIYDLLEQKLCAKTPATARKTKRAQI